VDVAGFKDLRIRVYGVVDVSGVRPLHRIPGTDDDERRLEGEIDDGDIAHAGLAAIATWASTTADLNSTPTRPATAWVLRRGHPRHGQQRDENEYDTESLHGLVLQS
jgi:hypothetical protein